MAGRGRAETPGPGGVGTGGARPSKGGLGRQRTTTEGWPSPPRGTNDAARGHPRDGRHHTGSGPAGEGLFVPRKGHPAAVAWPGGLVLRR